MRKVLLKALQQELEPLDYVLALWEMGSTAMGRADQWSDLDLLVLVRDGYVAETQQQIEQALLRVQPLGLRFELPSPTWHGHWQAFYRLQRTSPYLLIDLIIIEESHPNRFLEPELHGRPRVYFDKQGLIRPVVTPAAEFAAKLRQRLPLLEVPAELFHPFVDKELIRGREIDALHFYQGLLIPRLIEALRMRYSPWRYSFGLRYLSHDLPPEVYAQVHPLVFVSDPAELPVKKTRAMALLRQTLAELRHLDLVALLEESRSA